MEPEKLAVMNVGKVNAKRRLGESVEDLMACNITQTLGTMLDTVVFKQTNEQEGGAVEADDDAMETS